MTYSHKNLAVLFALLWGALVFFTFGPLAHADVVRQQLLNNVSFVITPYCSTTGCIWYSDIGFVASSTVNMGGVQLWFATSTAGTQSSYSVCINRYASQAAYQNNPTQSIYSACQTTGSGNASGLTDFPITGTAPEFQLHGVPFYYAISIQENTGTRPHSLPAILGTDTSVGATIFTNFGSPVSGFPSPFATSTNSQFYFQLYTAGSAPSSYFTPDPTFAGYSTQSVAALCDTVATSTSWFDSAAASIANGFCRVSVFLFAPSDNSLNQFVGLASTTSNKFPFSYFFSIKNTWTELTASSTANAPTYAYNLHDLGLGSTTPLGNFLPNVDVLSSTTVETYLKPPLLATFKGLAGLVIILTLFADIFFTIKGLPRN